MLDLGASCSSKLLAFAWILWLGLSPVIDCFQFVHGDVHQIYRRRRGDNEAMAVLDSWSYRGVRAPWFVLDREGNGPGWA